MDTLSTDRKTYPGRDPGEQLHSKGSGVLVGGKGALAAKWPAIPWAASGPALQPGKIRNCPTLLCTGVASPQVT